MRDLVLKMSMSLDGFVSGPKGEQDWFLRWRGQDSGAWVLETLQQAGVHALGRRSFEELAAFWPTAAGPMAAPMNDVPKVVFTRQGSFDPRAAVGEAWPAGNAGGEAGWGSARVASGDLTEEVQRLKAEPGGPILAQGGVAFARSLVRLGLVDEYRLVVAPVALGVGLPLFADLPAPLDLELVDATRFERGVMAQVYRPIRG
jgi:dihydrofolate reductase